MDISYGQASNGHGSKDVRPIHLYLRIKVKVKSAGDLLMLFIQLWFSIWLIKVGLNWFIFGR